MKGAGGLMEAIVRAFVDSKLTPLIVVSTILLGVFSIVAAPREEEPQITVPMMDVSVEMPGASAAEVEQRVGIPIEKKILEIPGVEYVYTTAMPGGCLTVVRFQVGADEERATVRLHDKLLANLDLLPATASRPTVRARSIDDVPILALTLSGLGHHELRRIAAELDDEIRAVPDVASTALTGGLRRQVRIEPDPAKLAARGVDLASLPATLSSANAALRAGSFARADSETLIDAGQSLRGAGEIEAVVVAVRDGRPVRLADVARVTDGPEEPRELVFTTQDGRDLKPAVTISVAKRKGSNAVDVAEQVLAKLEALRGVLIPASVRIEVTRNYGETAREKSDELLYHLAIAIVSVTILVALFLGWRASMVVMIAVPATLALTLLVYYLYGYTINRVTLFALIFSIGILVDDPIVDVENIVRHFDLPENHGKSRLEITVEAVNEVRSPLILATLAVVFAILPMAFVRGLMGPYMRPIPIGASTAMLFSMAIAFVVTPWAASKLLSGGHHAEGESGADRLYRKLMRPLVYGKRLRAAFLAGVAALFLASVALVPLGLVQVKMLPFDNKSELQVVIDMPEGTTLERTVEVARVLAERVGTLPEVRSCQIYAGASSPFNFNGLVRHYFLRRGPNMADIQVNLRPKHERSAQSHEIAGRVRDAVAQAASKLGARVKVAEVPPGPPVLQTLVAECYGPTSQARLELASGVMQVFEKTCGVVDADWYVEDPQRRMVVEVDRTKAAVAGLDAGRIVDTLAIAVSGREAGLLHLEDEKEPVPLLVRLARENRFRTGSLAVGGVPLSELTRVTERVEPPYVYRKNGRRVVYVTGDVAREIESPVYAILQMNDAVASLPQKPELWFTRQPQLEERGSVKWDGEWQITYEVFRDLGLAFAAVLVLVYMLVVSWFQSFRTPLVILAPIPLSLIGILPAHWATGFFFTATSVIGFIAGAGIVVRNSIILVDFVELRRSQGLSLEEAVIDAGAVRFRPMLLTASAVVVGAGVILFDPIFQGLALSLIAGETASTLLSRVAIPLLYCWQGGDKT